MTLRVAALGTHGSRLVADVLARQRVGVRVRVR